MVIDYGKLIYGDVDSSDYGIYISGEGVYDAPERAVEFVNVPGRNGAIALDQGRYENIQVTYPAMVLENDQESFRERLGRFRNAILSQKGYQRLEDSYHPDEFRMGVYHAGLSVSDLLTYHQGGNFELTFNCKPQRWLTVGDLPVPVESGDVLLNPTPFDSRPLLEIEGYGTIGFNGYEVEVDSALIGPVEIIQKNSWGEFGVLTLDKYYYFSTELFNVGDDITVDPVAFTFDTMSNSDMYTGVSYAVDGASTITPTVKVPSYSQSTAGNSMRIVITFPEITQAVLADTDSNVTKISQVNITATKQGGGTSTMALTTAVVFSHDYIRVVMSGSLSTGLRMESISYSMPAVQVDSTVSILGHPTYIDCDIGEAYKMIDDIPVSLNAKVALGSDLPVLAPGTNKIDFDNTVTDLKIVPRWWRV